MLLLLIKARISYCLFKFIVLSYLSYNYKEYADLLDNFPDTQKSFYCCKILLPSFFDVITSFISSVMSYTRFLSRKSWFDGFHWKIGEIIKRSHDCSVTVCFAPTSHRILADLANYEKWILCDVNIET